MFTFSLYRLGELVLLLTIANSISTSRSERLPRIQETLINLLDKGGLSSDNCTAFVRGRYSDVEYPELLCGSLDFFEVIYEYEDCTDEDFNQLKIIFCKENINNLLDKNDATNKVTINHTITISASTTTASTPVSTTTASTPVSTTTASTPVSTTTASTPVSTTTASTSSSPTTATTSTSTTTASTSSSPTTATTSTSTTTASTPVSTTTASTSSSPTTETTPVSTTTTSTSVSTTTTSTPVSTTTASTPVSTTTASTSVSPTTVATSSSPTTVATSSSPTTVATSTSTSTGTTSDYPTTVTAETSATTKLTTHIIATNTEAPETTTLTKVSESPEIIESPSATKLVAKTTVNTQQVMDNIKCVEKNIISNKTCGKFIRINTNNYQNLTKGCEITKNPDLLEQVHCNQNDTKVLTKVLCENATVPCPPVPDLGQVLHTLIQNFTESCKMTVETKMEGILKDPKLFCKSRDNDLIDFCSDDEMLKMTNAVC